MRTLLAALLLCGASILCGCPPGQQTVGPAPPAPVDAVDSVNLWVRPTAMNWDDRPGPDGVQVQVYFFRRDAEHKLPLTVSGSVDMILYEGNVKRSEMSAAKPFHTWRFSPAQMKGFLSRGMAGWCYTLTLPWGATAPQADTVTLTAKYTAPAGAALYAAPASISMGPK